MLGNPSASNNVGLDTTTFAQHPGPYPAAFLYGVYMYNAEDPTWGDTNVQTVRGVTWSDNAGGALVLQRTTWATFYNASFQRNGLPGIAGISTRGAAVEVVLLSDGVVYGADVTANTVLFNACTFQGGHSTQPGAASRGIGATGLLAVAGHAPAGSHACTIAP